ncbi:MAG: putative transcriptional regulator [Oleispira sp.]|jgi:putative transcriptional regulator
MAENQTFGSLTDHFLIAMPTLKDSSFEHSITYICSHDDNGAMGIVLNQSTDLNFQEILEQLEIEGIYGHDHSVLLGGPVHQDHGFILHLEKGDWRSTLSVTDDIHVSTSKDILTSLAQGNGPKQYKIALGYAGWEAGQLEQELLDNAWITVEATADIIFNTPEDKMYQAALKLLGIDEGFLSSDAGHA